MSEKRVAVIWMTKIPDIENTTRYQRAKTLDQAYDCHFFLFTASGTISAEFLDTPGVKQQGQKSVLSMLIFLAQTLYQIGIADQNEFNAVHTSYHPLACIAGFICKMMGIQWIHDIWDHPKLSTSEVSSISNSTALAEWVAKHSLCVVSHRLISTADLVVLSLHPDFANEIGLEHDHCVSIPNGTRLSIYEEVESEETDEFTIVYTGVVIADRGIETLLKAGALLSDKIDEFSIVLIGEVRDEEWLRKTIRQYDLTDSVEITGVVPHDTVLRTVAGADVGICLFPSVNETEYIYPIKLFEYMALGAVSVSSNLTGISSVVEHGENGFLVSPGDATETARTILTVYDSTAPIEHSAKETVEQYDWSCLNDRFEMAVEEVIR